jgi:endonuclease III
VGLYFYWVAGNATTSETDEKILSYVFCVYKSEIFINRQRIGTKNKFNIMDKIVEIAKKRFRERKTQDVHLVADSKANELLNDIENNPHVYVLACLMDRQIKAERAWNIPLQVFDYFGTHEINKLAEIPLEDYKKVFNGKKLHHFNDMMAEYFYKAILRINETYKGNAAKIWQGKPSSALVVYRFLEFEGCGIKIATMAANLLARLFDVEFSDYYSIEVSPDIHVMRVMKRIGYISQNADREMAIYKARELNPEFPGIIDAFCWDLGTTCCRPVNPKCNECIINNECKKQIKL